MIKKTTVLGLLLVILLVEISRGEHSSTATAWYDTIENWFIEATSGDLEPEEALSNFKEIVNSYEQNTEVRTQGRAFQYYCYAQGMILINEGDYENAIDKLKNCGKLANAKEYISFAKGMILKAAGAEDVFSYKEAMAAFEEALECEALGSVAAIQYDECDTLYKNTLLQLGDQAFDSGDYQKALEYYEALANENSAVGKQKYKQCQEMIKQDEMPVVSIDEKAMTFEPRSLIFNFSARVSECMLSVSVQPGDLTLPDGVGAVQPDVQRLVVQYECTATDTQQWKIGGMQAGTYYTLQVNGLLPDTDYQVSFFDLTQGTIYAQFVIKTAQLDVNVQLTTALYEFVSYSLTEYRVIRSGGLKEGFTVWNALLQTYTLQKNSDAIINVGDKELQTIGNAVAISVTAGDALGMKEFSLKELIRGKEYQMILRVDSVGVTATASRICEGENDNISALYDKTADNNMMMWQINDLLSEALAKYHQIAGQAFTLDLVLDNTLLCTVSGTLKQ